MVGSRQTETNVKTKTNQGKEQIKKVSKRTSKKCIRDKKNKKARKKNEYWKSSKEPRTYRASYLRGKGHSKIKNEIGEVITSRKGIANVFGEFYSKLYADDQCDEKLQEPDKTKMRTSKEDKATMRRTWKKYQSSR